jgi:hypothetical protein
MDKFNFQLTCRPNCTHLKQITEYLGEQYVKRMSYREQLAYYTSSTVQNRMVFETYT